MKALVSPLTIQMALAFHYSAEPTEEIGFDRFNSPAGREIRGWLFANGLIDREDDMARGTEKLNAWVKGICSVGLPVCEWRIPETSN